jgi:hypothetical protein
MTEAKYVMFKSPLYGEFPVCFPNIIEHNMMIQAICNEYPGIKPVSAGFYNSDFTCYGNSKVLNLKSRRGDTVLLQLLIRPKGAFDD